MTTFIGMIRGVNVGGHKKLPMAALKALCDSLKLTSAKTHLNSGNVVFQSTRKDRPQLRRDLEDAIRKKIGIDVKVILRTPDEIRCAMTANPFPKRDPSRLLIMFLEGEPSDGAMEALREAHAGPEKMHFAGQELVIDYVNGVGRSKLTNAVIERKLAVAGTARNWNTVSRLLELAENLNSPPE